MKLVERRREPRHVTSFPSIVRTRLGESLRAVTTNISLSGLELSGSHRLVTTLFPNYKRPDSHEPLEVTVEMEVPSVRQVKNMIAICCHLIYARRVNKNLYNIGCKFSKISNESEKFLTNYIKGLNEKCCSSEESKQ